jgi:hypothetical protein
MVVLLFYFYNVQYYWIHPIHFTVLWYYNLPCRYWYNNSLIPVDIAEKT